MASHLPAMLHRLRLWGHGHFLPVFCAGESTADMVNSIVPAFERMLDEMTAGRLQGEFCCSVGRRHTVGCATLRALFPADWWTASFVFSRAFVVMGGPVENRPLFVLSETPVGNITEPESYRMTFVSLCGEPDWACSMLFIVADDHREDEDTGCWSTLYETFCGIVQVLKSDVVMSHDFSMVFTMANVSTHDVAYWTSLLRVYDPKIDILDEHESPTDALVSRLQTIYIQGDVPISSDMKPFFWMLENDMLFYAGYNADEDCFLIGKCGLSGEVM